MGNKHSRTEQQAIAFIGAEVIQNTDGDDTSYNASLLTHEQALNFIDSDYETKACVSLNQIFIPYATYPNSDMPRGYNISSSLSGINNYHSSGICLTSNSSTTTLEDIDSDCMYYGNTRMNDVESYWSGVDKKLYQRSVGLNRNIFLIGSDGTQTVAGPLDVTWHASGGVWRAAATEAQTPTRFGVGYCESAITAPASRGAHTTFTTTFGTCRNYDMSLDITNYTDVFIVALYTSGEPVVALTSGVTYSNTPFYLPLYVGCEL